MAIDTQRSSDIWLCRAKPDMADGLLVRQYSLRALYTHGVLLRA